MAVPQGVLPTYLENSSAFAAWGTPGKPFLLYMCVPPLDESVGPDRTKLRLQSSLGPSITRGGCTCNSLSGSLLWGEGAQVPMAVRDGRLVGWAPAASARRGLELLPKSLLESRLGESETLRPVSKGAWVKPTSADRLHFGLHEGGLVCLSVPRSQSRELQSHPATGSPFGGGKEWRMP